MKEPVTCDMAMLDNLSVMRCVMAPIPFNILLLIMNHNTISKRDLLIKCEEIGIKNSNSVNSTINNFKKRHLIYVYNQSKGFKKIKYRANKRLIQTAISDTVLKINE